MNGDARECPRCHGTGEQVQHQPTIVDDPATITFTVCGRCHGDGTIPRMDLEWSAKKHIPMNWPATRCSCGYEGGADEVYAHWAFYGIKWASNNRRLEWSRA